MPRPSYIDSSAALDGAMTLFWARGYGAASFNELTAVSGAARYGLYVRFGDKRGLYLAALAHYEQVIVNRLFSGVEAAGAGARQVRGYFDSLLAMAASPQGAWGCLLVNAAVETAPFDPEVARITAAYRQRLQAGFARAAGAGKADALAALVFGLQVQARAGTAPDVLAAAVAGGL